MRYFCIAALLLCVMATSALAQTAGPNGFYYPVASINTAATFLETGCDGYISQRFHLGWDLAQPYTTPVYAITGGVIANVTNTGDQDVTFIWIKHKAVDPSNGNTFDFWSVYGHTSIATGLGQGSTVQAGQVIGYTIIYKYEDGTRGDHCHFGVNRSGIITTITDATIGYINSAGQSASTTVQVGWGRSGLLPSGWCSHESQNKALLQANSAAIEGFTDPQAFLNTYHAVGFGGNGTDIYVNANFSGTQTGTSTNPYRTLTQGINAASSTQAVTIHITPGTYSEKISTSKHIHFVTNGSGTVRIGG